VQCDLRGLRLHVVLGRGGLGVEGSFAMRWLVGSLDRWLIHLVGLIFWVDVWLVWWEFGFLV